MLYTRVSYFTYYLLFFYLKGGGPTKKSKIDNGEKEGEEDDKEIGEADKEKAGEKEEEEKEKETKMETEEQQPPPAAAADKQEEETDEKKKTSEKEESKQDAQPMDAQQEVKQVSIHHTHFAFCVSVMWVWLVIKLVDWYYYYYVESIPLHPLYRSICVHCTQYVHPLYPLLVFCPLDLVIYASMVPAYHLMSTVSVRPLFLYCLPLSCFCTIVRQLHM